MEKNRIKKIAEFVLEHRSIDILKYDSIFLQKAIDRKVSNSESFQKVIDMFSQNPAAMTDFIESLNISFSEFFRNQLTFTYLEEILIPLIVEKKKKSKENEIRIWSTACASGQEPYSVAILLEEALSQKNTEISYRIFATDISSKELNSAGNGLYQVESLNKVTLKNFRKYFSEYNGTFKISEILKNHVSFSVFDLLSDGCICPPESIYGNFDIIFCCNVLFYYKPEIRKKILEKIKICLNDGGFLITGESERDFVAKNGYIETFFASSIFKKRGE